MPAPPLLTALENPSFVEARWSPVEDSAFCHESNVGHILGIVCTFCAASIVAVALRLYARAVIIKSVGPDDWVMVLALLMAIGTMIGFIGETKHGVGRHTDCISMDDTQKQAHWTYFHSIWVALGVTFVKISIAFFLLRLAAKKWWRNFLWGCIIFLSIWAVASSLAFILQCIPIQAAWDYSLKEEAKCYEPGTIASIGVLNSVINIITDFLFALAPIPIIIKLQVPMRAKFTLIFILSLGFVACAAGIVKASRQAVYYETPDATWEYDFHVWNMIELGLGIIAASLPALKPLFSRFFAGTRTRLGLSGSRSGENGTAKKSAYAGLGAGSNAQHSKKGRSRTRSFISSPIPMHNLSAAPSDPSLNARTATPPDMDAKNAYDVRVTSGDGGDDRSWDSGLSGRGGHGQPAMTAEFPRSESEERLHAPGWAVPPPPPAGGIFRTTEISRTSEARR